MKNLLIPLLLILLFSSCSHEIFRSLDWQRTKVTADGWNIEWPDQPRFLDPKTRITYGISNDLYNLYVCINVTDPAIKEQIIHGGMEFRIDTLGKKLFPVVFGFPVAGDMTVTREMHAAVHKNDRQGERQVTPVMRQKIVTPATEARLAGFKPPFNGTMSLVNNTSGISAALNIDSLDVLCYEAVIPLNTFFKESLTAADTGRVFNYEIRINAMAAPQAHDGAGSPGGNSGRGKGMDMSGGMGSGMSGGTSGGHHGGNGGQHNGFGGSASRGGEHRDNSGPAAGNDEMFTAKQITNKLRFSVK